MTIIKYDDDNLLLHSPIPISPSLTEQLNTLGHVKILMAPNLMHNLFINEWKQQYEKATLIAPKNIKKVDFDLSLENITRDNHRENNREFELPSNTHMHFVAGMKGLHEYAVIHTDSRTLILTDLAFNIQRTEGIWSNIFFRLYGAYGKFGPTRLTKTIIKNRKKFSESIDTILEYEFDKIIVSHGDLISENGKSEFKRAFFNIR